MSKLVYISKPKQEDKPKDEHLDDSFIKEMDKFILERMTKKETSKPVSPVVKEEPPPEKKAETAFTREDKENLIARKLEEIKKKGGRLRRRERKMIEDREYDGTQRTRNIIIGLSVFALIFIGFARNYLPNEAMYSIILLMGMTLFFPLGMIAGWIVLDPVMRCKIIRKTTKRNYGVVGFVGKGMKAVLKLKNFDEGLIWRDKECWVITKDKIVQFTKDGNAITNTAKEIDAESVITLVDTVPMIFVDVDSMEPLLLHQKDRIPVYPMEIGPCMKAWMDNQRAKMMQIRKAQDILLYIAILCAAGAIVVGFLTMNKVENMSSEITVMHNMLQNMSRII